MYLQNSLTAQKGADVKSFEAEKEGRKKEARATSSFVGVLRVNRRFEARISIDGKRRRLGSFEHEAEAAKR